MKENFNCRNAVPNVLILYPLTEENDKNTAWSFYFRHLIDSHHGRVDLPNESLHKISE